MSVATREGVYSRQTNPVLRIALVICVGGAAIAYAFDASAFTVFLIVGAALAIQLWHAKKRGAALVSIENDVIMFLENLETPHKHARIPISDIIEIAIAGLPDDQRYRFRLADGRAIVLRPYFERQYNEQILRFLEAKFANNVRIDNQGPLGPTEEMRGDFKTP